MLVAFVALHPTQRVLADERVAPEPRQWEVAVSAEARLNVDDLEVERARLDKPAAANGLECEGVDATLDMLAREGARRIS